MTSAILLVNSADISSVGTSGKSDFVMSDDGNAVDPPVAPQVDPAQHGFTCRFSRSDSTSKYFCHSVIDRPIFEILFAFYSIQISAHFICDMSAVIIAMKY